MTTFHLNNLPKQNRIQMIGEFYDTIDSLKDRDEVRLFVKGLLTADEIANLMRRIEIAVLLSGNYKYKEIIKMLGVGNEKILENIRYLSEKGAKIWFRYMVLPGYTDTKKNLAALVSFLKKVNFELIELLPYHTYGVYKWKELGLKYQLEGAKPPSHKSVLEIKKMLEKEGFKVLLNE